MPISSDFNGQTNGETNTQKNTIKKSSEKPRTVYISANVYAALKTNAMTIAIQTTLPMDCNCRVPEMFCH